MVGRHNHLVWVGMDATDADVRDLGQQLAAAARDGDDARVTTLLDSGANCDATHDLGDPNDAGCSAVNWAARGGHLSTFRLLKSAGANVLAPADSGVTPFMAACGGGSLQIVRELKDAGVDPSATTNRGFNAAHAAAHGGHLDILGALRDCNVDVSATANNGANAAHFASQEGHLDILRELRDWDVDVSATDNDGFNAVHFASMEGHLETLRSLRDWNVDVSATINSGHNAVHFAAWKGHLHILTEIKPWHVDLDAEEHDGTTPLKIAVVEKSDLRTAQHLILLGAQVRPADFPASHYEISQQLMAWTDDHLARHRVFVFTVLTAIHDDGSHTTEGQTNWLAHLAGTNELRVSLAEYLDIRVGAEHVALANADRLLKLLCA